MTETPRVRSPFNVSAQTWTRLPDSGFEIQHDGPGVQAIDALPRTVLVRRLGPEVTGSAAAVGEGTADTVPATVPAGHSCDFCLAADRIYTLALMIELDRPADPAAGRMADSLLRLAERAGRRDTLGRALTRTILGQPSAAGRLR
jgi:hypothetical protein